MEERATEIAVAGEREVETVQVWPHRIGRARLRERVFDIDLQRCPNCGGGELKIIPAILDRPVIERILTHLGLDPQPPPKGRALEAGQYESHLSCAGRRKYLALGRNARPQTGGGA